MSETAHNHRCPRCGERLRCGADDAAPCDCTRVTLDAAQVVAQLKQQIANFKVPKQVFVVKELPRNAMGKVQKALLREQHQRLFNT